MLLISTCFSDYMGLVEALVTCVHIRHAKMVSVTGAGRLQELVAYRNIKKKGLYGS